MAKNDEFYTRLEDIEREVFHYKKHFAGKVVYCNCDDPAESNFFKDFALNIKAFQIKKLIATCYDGSCIADTQLSLFDYENENEKTTRHAHKIELVPEDFDTTQITMDLVRKTIEEKHLIHKLKGNGDFRSEECIELLKEADIVCTNPPFSLFREYVAQLVEYDKKFLVIGNQNAITYKEIFPLIKENKIWSGYYHIKEFKQKDGTYKKFGNIQWFTNLEHSKRNEELVLWKRYAEEPDHFPKYDNYDAINVDKVVEIPMDYVESWGVCETFYKTLDPNKWQLVRESIEDEIHLFYVVPSKENELYKLYHSHSNGYKEEIENALAESVYCSGNVGVPITFLDKYNPKQFRIYGLDRYVKDNPRFGHRFTINNKETYARILVQSLL